MTPRHARRRGLSLLVGLSGAAIAACNLLTGAEDLRVSGSSSTQDGAAPCTNCDGGSVPMREGGVVAIDSAFVSDVQKPGDDDAPGGFLDSSYGTNGVAQHDLLDDARAIAVQSDGKAIVAGTSGAHLAIVRLLTTGAVDTSFGTDGRVRIENHDESEASGVAVDSQGRIIAVGTTTDIVTTCTGTTRHMYAYAVRVTSAGVVDEAFADDGRLKGQEGEAMRSVAVTVGDGVVIGGSAGSPFVVWRLTAEGAADAAFGASGRTVVPIANGTSFGSMAATPSAITVAGGATGERLDFAVGQVAPDGGIIGSFADGKGAKVSFGPDDDVASTVAVQPDGKVIVAGEVTLLAPRSPQYGVARLKADGALDGTFGVNGVVMVSFPNDGTWRDVNERVRGMAIDSRGRIVLAGGIFERTPPPGPKEFHSVALARLTPQGQLDRLFGAEGKLVFSDTFNRLQGTAMARADDGKLYVLGSVDKIGGFVVARITP